MLQAICVGKGETKTIIINIKDKDSVLLQTDTVLFALKKFSDFEKPVIKTQRVLVSEMTYDQEKQTYKFPIQLDTEFTKELELGTYMFDLTLVNQNNDNIVLTKPIELVIVPTIGASISEEE